MFTSEIIFTMDLTNVSVDRRAGPEHKQGSHRLVLHIVKRPDFLVVHRVSKKIWKHWTNTRIISKIHHILYFRVSYIMGNNSLFLNYNRDLDHFLT